MTPQMWQNLQAYKRLLADKLQSPSLRGQIACIRVDRNPTGKMGPWFRCDDTVETFTTGNQYIFLMSLGEGETPSIHRFLNPSERAALVGVDPRRLAELSKAEVLKVTGNCYTVPMIGVCLASVLHAAFVADPVPSHVKTKSAHGGSIVAWLLRAAVPKKRLHQKTAMAVGVKLASSTTVAANAETRRARRRRM